MVWISVPIGEKMWLSYIRKNYVAASKLSWRQLVATSMGNTQTSVGMLNNGISGRISYRVKGVTDAWAKADDKLEWHLHQAHLLLEPLAN